MAALSVHLNLILSCVDKNHLIYQTKVESQRSTFRARHKRHISINVGGVYGPHGLWHSRSGIRGAGRISYGSDMESGYIRLRWRYFRNEYRAKVSIKGFRTLSEYLGHKIGVPFLIYSPMLRAFSISSLSVRFLFSTEGKLCSLDRESSLITFKHSPHSAVKVIAT